MSVKIAGSGDAIRQIPHDSSVTLPIRAHSIAIAIVPFRPTHGKISDLISSFAEVPRLGNQLYLGEHGILMDDVEECPQAINFM